MLQVGKNIATLKDDNDLLRKQLADNMAHHNLRVKAMEESATLEIEKLKPELVEKDGIIQVQTLQADETAKAHQEATTTMRIELEKVTE